MLLGKAVEGRCGGRAQFLLPDMVKPSSLPQRRRVRGSLRGAGSAAAAGTSCLGGAAGAALSRRGRKGMTAARFPDALAV